MSILGLLLLIILGVFILKSGFAIITWIISFLIKNFVWIILLIVIIYFVI